jgi:hypothetical protein
MVGAGSGRHAIRSFWASMMLALPPCGRSFLPTPMASRGALSFLLSHAALLLAVPSPKT